MCISMSVPIIPNVIFFFQLNQELANSVNTAKLMSFNFRKYKSTNN